MVAGLAVALRLAAALYLGNTITEQPGIFDELSYHTLANRVLDGHGFTFGTGWWPATQPNEPTAHWSYLYVLLLSGIYALFGSSPLVARLLQAVLCGVLQPLLAYSIARRLFGSRVGVATAAVVACYAYFIYYAGALVTESLYIVAVLWAVRVAIEMTDAREAPPLASWRVLGLAAGMAILLRQAMLLLAPVLLAWTGWRLWTRMPGLVGAARGRGRTRVLWGVCQAVGVVVLCVAPWTVRNYFAFGQFVPLNTNAGFALFWGNHPVHGTNFVPILPGSVYGTLIPSDLDGLNEAALDKALLQRALRFVRDEPGRFAWISLDRAKEYVKFWPSEDSGRLSNLARVLSFGVCFPFLVSGLGLVVLKSGGSSTPQLHSGVWFLIGIAAAYSLIHILSWTLTRYRLPVDALMMPFIGLSIVHVCSFASYRRHMLSAPPGVGGVLE
jgi:hypothetical protein